MKHGLGTEIMNKIFIKSNTMNRVKTRSYNKNDFFLSQVNTVHYGHASLRYLGCKIWGLVPECIKMSQSVAQFKNQLNTGYRRLVHADCVRIFYQEWAILT